MQISGFTGISFPFRIGPQGGVILSSTNLNNPTHIEESIIQILSTGPLERVMEAEIYSEVDTLLFEPSDESLQSILRLQIVDALSRLEPRIEVSSDGIEFETDDEDGVTCLYVTLTYKVIQYETFYTSTVKVGEI